MKITYPPGKLCVDLSLWNDHINAQEFIDGGVVSAILGLYKEWNGVKYVLNKNCKRIISQIAASPLILQAYYYYYPQYDPIEEANWFLDTMITSGCNIRFAWADCENKDAEMDKHVRSERYRIFTDQVASHFSRMGVYTNKAFIVEHAPQMDTWINKYPAWVAQYKIQPKIATQMTWDTLKSTWLPNYDIILSSGQTNPVGHQFTGDRCILPGAYNAFNQRQALDVSVFTDAFIKSIVGNAPVPVPTPIPVPVPNPLPIPGPATNYVAYSSPYNRLNVRATPSVDGVWVGYLEPKEVIYINPTKIENGYVLFQPTAKFPKGGYVFFQYLTKI